MLGGIGRRGGRGLRRWVGGLICMRIGLSCFGGVVHGGGCGRVRSVDGLGVVGEAVRV